jgi:hypothetical protein
MPNELPPDDPRSVWQNQTVEHTAMSLTEIRQKAGSYQKQIRFRNSLEYAAVVFIVAFFSHTVWTVHYAVMRVGAGLCIAGSLYMSWQLHKRGSAKTVPADFGWTTCLGFHRGELVRQRDLLRTSWSWYLGPLLLGIVVIALGAGIANPRHAHYAWAFIGGYLAVTILGFLGLRRYHVNCVRRLQKQIDELDSLENQ